jgi:CBS domain containing-hemolysin-like protein
MAWEITAVVSLVSLAFSAFFSGAETGYMSVSRVRLQRIMPTDRERAGLLSRQLRDIEQPILTCLIGTNLFNVLFSAVATVALTARFGTQGQGIAMAAVSVLVILFGEILPKVLFREFPEPLTLAAARGVAVAMTLTAPVRWVLRQYTRLWKRLLPAGVGEDPLDRRRLAALLLTNTVPRPNDNRFATALNRYLQLAGHSLAESMKPVEELVRVGPDSTVGECLAVAARSGYSRLPLAREDGRHLQAYVLVRDLLFLPREFHDRTVPRRLWRSFLQVDARMSPYEIFEEMRGQRRQLAVVVDPGGNPLGMITLEDLIETVTGSIRDEFDAAEKRPAQPARGGSDR